VGGLDLISFPLAPQGAREGIPIKNSSGKSNSPHPPGFLNLGK